MTPYFTPHGLKADWPTPAHIQTIFTLRGKLSGKTEPITPALAGFNLGLHVGDAIESVQARRRMLASMSASPIGWLHQIHKEDILDLDRVALEQCPTMPTHLVADGATTTRAHIGCAVMVADCLPILIFDAATERIAALHAGWRGLSGINGKGIIETFFSTYFSPSLPEKNSAKASWATSNIMVWLGPCIGSSNFEVGQDVFDSFVKANQNDADCFTPSKGQKYLANLAFLARNRLNRLNIEAIYGNDDSPLWCTFSNPQHYYSYRRDPKSGRHAALIWKNK